MSAAAENKALLQRILGETAKGNGRPFVDALAPDAVWTIIGDTEWSRPYRGKRAIVGELLVPLAANFEGPNLFEGVRYIAEDDLVAVEARNHSVTKAGAQYPQRYAMIFRLRDGQIAEITEYADTELMSRVLNLHAPA
jgi:ketosteroid isomerase-like protein